MYVGQVPEKEIDAITELPRLDTMKTSENVDKQVCSKPAHEAHCQ